MTFIGLVGIHLTPFKKDTLKGNVSLCPECERSERLRNLINTGSYGQVLRANQILKRIK